MVKSYKDLDIWKRAVELVVKIYLATKGFPGNEVYGLVAQMRRAAVSVPSNISEGFARQHNREYKQFLYIALGSCAELDTQLIIADKLKYMNAEEVNSFQEDVNILSRMIMSLIKKLN